MQWSHTPEGCLRQEMCPKGGCGRGEWYEVGGGRLFRESSGGHCRNWISRFRVREATGDANPGLCMARSLRPMGVASRRCGRRRASLCRGKAGLLVTWLGRRKKWLGCRKKRPMPAAPSGTTVSTGSAGRVVRGPGGAGTHPGPRRREPTGDVDGRVQLRRRGARPFRSPRPATPSRRAPPSCAGRT